MQSFRHSLLLAAAALPAFSTSSPDLIVSPDNPGESAKVAAGVAASNAMRTYMGNRTGGIPGIIGESTDSGANGIFWWQSAALFDGLINYWANTNDTQYNNVVAEGMLFQVGDDYNFQPQNQTFDLGNDDQGYWALASMSAAERGFPILQNANTTWLGLADAVFNMQAPRWDNATCGGGLRWQFNPINSGYDYKSTSANAVFFQLATRLYRFTKNETYAQQATMAYDWMSQVGLVDDQDGATAVYDGAHVQTNCSQLNKQQFSVNAAAMLYGSAIMANMTSSNEWRDRTTSLSDGFKKFFTNDLTPVIVESACESIGTCNTDMTYYKGLSSTYLGSALVMAPYVASTLRPILGFSAAGAANACNSDGGCVFSWVGVESSATTASNVDAMDVFTAWLTPTDLQLRTNSSGPAPTSTVAFGNWTADGSPGAPVSGPSSTATIAPVQPGASPSKSATGNAAASGLQSSWAAVTLGVVALPFMLIL